MQTGRITSITALPVSLPVNPEVMIKSSLGQHRVSRYAIVQLETEEGVTGWGEATVMPIWSGETQEGAMVAIDSILAPALVGSSVFEVSRAIAEMDRVLVDNPFVKAAVEMAILDAAGKLAGRPVCDLLGGARRRAMPLKFSIGAFSPEGAARVALRMIERGLRAVKVKVGIDWRSDIERVQAVRDAAGPSFPIGVDANGGWNEAECNAALASLERLNVNVIEQPFRRADIGAAARLRQRTHIPVMLDEGIFTREHALAAIRANACDVISIYPGKNGGIWRSLEIAILAESAGLECILGSNLEWDLGSAAMLHAAAVIPNLSKTIGSDIIGPLYHDDRPCNPLVRYENGCALLPDGPGLGIGYRNPDA